MTMTDTAGLLIDGTRVPSATGATLTIHNPATGEPMATVAAAGPKDVQRALDAARAAQPGWARMHPRERGEVLYALAARIRHEHDELARLESLDTGKPLRQALADVDVSAEYFEFYAGLADKVYGDTIPLAGDNFAMTFREPHGVTGHIIPWNYPLQIGSRTVAPGLMAGNAAVVKPAEEAPLSALRLGELALEAGMPAGVLNVVPGLGEVAGAYLAGSASVDHVSFTGSVAAGQHVMIAAAGNVRPVVLELGGKSPSVVFEDADFDRVVPVLTQALIQNAGQTCSAGTRVVVVRPLRDALVEALAAAFEQVQLGPGIDDPDMGPLISERQRDRVVEYLGIAEEEGAQRATNGVGTLPKHGYFVRPTLLVGVTPSMRVAQEEIFGPVLCVLEADDEDEAIRIANSTLYGLVASVWTRDLDRALRVSRRIRAGQVYVNSYGAAGGVPIPFGGTGHSGFGREKGVEAVHEYTQTKAIAIHVGGNT